MYLCFIDESGHIPSKGSPKVRYFVIAALIIPESQWQEISREFEAAKRRFKVEGEIKWQFFGPDNTSKGNCLLHLSFDERSKLRNQLLASITKRKSCRIVATKSEMAKAWQQGYIKSKMDVYHYTYKQTLERVNYFLQDMSKVTGDFQRGLVVCDHRGKDDDRAFRDYHAVITEKESAYTSRFEHFVERVMLTESHHSVGIQLVDLCAGAIGHAFNHDKMSWIDTLRPNIRAHPQKGIDGFGLVHWPK
ncbi:DUF3800 domain-containing protein [Sphingopyxis sp.]|uniref:DUF3800 domain-containing protein n=1 Tax=Sphingopyxis sp. TaxID=1908224 RepID=UPI003BACFBA8